MKKIAILLISSLLAVSIFAKEPIETTMSVFIVSKDGKLNPVESQEKNQVAPGQMLEYVISYTNISEKAVKIQSADAMIPKDTVFVDQSNQTDEKSLFQVSIDGGKRFEEPPVKRKRIVNGIEQTYEVPIESYTHVRWAQQPAIASGKTQKYRYRVKVN